MKAKLFAVGALAAALLLAGVPLGTSSATAAAGQPKVQIMLAGDSITQGIDGDYTWRYRLAMEFRRQAITDKVDLVGPTTNPRGSYGHYLGGRTWDYDHDATGGTTLHYQLGLIGDQVATYQPDVLISFLGTNDFLAIQRAPANRGLSASALLPQYRAKVTQVLDDWATYINTARSKNTDIKIILGELITPKIPQQIRDDYNMRLTALAGDLSSFVSPIQVAQLDSPLWTSSRYLYDTIHPTPTGESMLAQLFADKLASITSDVTAPYGLFTSEPAIKKPYIAWNPPLRAKTRVVGRKIHIDWAFTVQYNRATKMRAKFGNTRARSTRTTVFTPSSNWTSTRLKPGVYRIRLQANRFYMKSNWSPVYTVRVR